MSYFNTPVPSFSDVPFSAGNFTGNNSMTWTVVGGDVTVYRWSLNGSFLSLQLKVGGTVGGTPSTKLIVALPAGLKAKNSCNFITTVNSLGTGFQFGFANITAGQGNITFQTSLATPFANWGAGACEVNFLGSFEVG